MITTRHKFQTLPLAFGSVAQTRHASPREGLSLAAATDVRSQPIRAAVAILTGGILSGRGGNILSGILHESPENILNPDVLPRRAAWDLVFIWLTARNSNPPHTQCGLQEAELWFHGETTSIENGLSSQVPVENLRKAEQHLNSVQFDAEFHALLPYILEENGPGSRASVIKDPTTAAARAAKKMTGVFYTPADVADFMVGHVRKLYQGDLSSAKCLDPACGTGVFLLAMLRAACAAHAEMPNFSRFAFITNFLYGLDVSKHALDAAAFVLLNECLSELTVQGLSPIAAWRQIRQNLVEIDALCIESSGLYTRNVFADLFQNPLSTFGQIFPRVEGGFDLLIGNPPYAALGNRADFPSLATRFASLRGVDASSRLNLYPLFVEMMWQFTKPGLSAAALVTPLSIAFHGGAQFENCRRAMSRHGGQWQFAFFDREPQALFGEEVKTRNAILFRKEDPGTPLRGQSANIETGPLRKWTSRTRHCLFEKIQFTPADSIEIISGIPKLAGAIQSEAFIKLRRRIDRLPALATRVGSCKLSEAFSGESGPKVFIGGTAYNFLNVYRPSTLLPQEQSARLSESSVHCLEFPDEISSNAAFSILSSRLSFWLWHVLGDGFHVASWLFDEIPFGPNSFDAAALNVLSSLGRALWENLQDYRFSSLNAGRLTIGFRPLACHVIRDQIDSILAQAAGLPETFIADIRGFVENNAIVDISDIRRNHIKKHFAESHNDD